MGFQPETFPLTTKPILQNDSHQSLLFAARDNQDDPAATITQVEEWKPLYFHKCSFPSKIFFHVMMNLIRNPNLNSNHLFRADVLLEASYKFDFAFKANSVRPVITFLHGFTLDTVIIRKLIPRNLLVDEPLDQTCLLYSGSTGTEARSLVVYLPHFASPSESPFYHPAVQGIAFLHTFSPDTKEGVVSIHYSFFESGPQTPLLDRTALHLLAILHKHGQGQASGYVKKFQHDTIIPQAVVQNTYSRLKMKYARTLCSNWVEATDPTKHVFEDLGICAFLIELWAQMYAEEGFPGFVDIGCGNGLLVHILLEEGFLGWGFDARRRKSWQTYSSKTQENLKELILIPSILQDGGEDSASIDFNDQQSNIGTHGGLFPTGTFIISNHSDELTPWTPILAVLSQSPFMMIPCCSHNLTGAKFRAPPPKSEGRSSSAYASLVSWVTNLAADCGWEMESEMLRIPSTRNTALIGRRRNLEYEKVHLEQILNQYGGTDGWRGNAMKLAKGSLRGH